MWSAANLINSFLWIAIMKCLLLLFLFDNFIKALGAQHGFRLDPMFLISSKAVVPVSWAFVIPAESNDQLGKLMHSWVSFQWAPTLLIYSIGSLVPPTALPSNENTIKKRLRADLGVITHKDVAQVSPGYFYFIHYSNESCGSHPISSYGFPVGQCLNGYSSANDFTGSIIFSCGGR